MRGRILRRAAILATLGVLGTAGAALAWEGNGNNNGWDNKHERGCPTNYAPAAASEEPLVDLNGDGTICTKISGNSGANYIDNISNH
jgi:hypothetical protein